ncbi:hypothetical protein [Streptomyces sp. NPDC051567]|uniref:hypothetical protein n=1 Tax=Streptomyces sp. NPDC051567 TaxID=3365660 RepID=UPI0037B194A8
MDCTQGPSRSSWRGPKAWVTTRRIRPSTGGSIRLIASLWAIGAGVMRGKSLPTSAARLNRRSAVTSCTSA